MPSLSTLATLYPWHAAFAYIVFNIDPVLLRIGPLAIHWYGLMYVVAISIGLWAVLRYTARLGIQADQLWRLVPWVLVAGLVGGRLYYVIQQPDLVSRFLLQPANIFAVWQGGMAFFGAIFLGSAALFAFAPRYGIDRFVALDGGAYFAICAQIFGRVGNLINGDILGKAASDASLVIPGSTCSHAPCIAYVADPQVSPWWSVVYLNPHSIAPTGIAYHPAPVYEMLLNLIVLALLLPVRFRLPRIRAGLFFLAYLALYAVSQLIVFFARGTEPIVNVLGTHILKQAQWTALIVLLLCIPGYYLLRRYAHPWRYSAAHPAPWPTADTADALPAQPPSATPAHDRG